MKSIYLDNNATTKVDPEVVKIMLPYFSERYANPSSLHILGQEVAGDVLMSRRIIAESINAKSSEVYFTASGSEGDNLCIKGYAEANKEKGNHIITSVIEHPGILNSCKHLETQGFEVTYLPVDDEGFISLDGLEKAIRPNTLLVSIMHINNEIGSVQPIKEIARICHKHGIMFHTDAVQSYQKAKIDVRDFELDMASFSGHKIHAPKGIGFVYIKEGLKVTRQVDGGGQETKMRAGTENTAYIAGLAKATLLTTDKDRSKMQKLQKYLMDELEKISNIRINGPKDLSRRGINNINISSNRMEGSEILQKLSDKGICVSTGSACSSKSQRVSPVLEAIGCPAEFIHGNIRISLSKYTTKDEVDSFLTSFKDILNSSIGSKLISEKI